jgi:hypothetical protein
MIFDFFVQLSVFMRKGLFEGVEGGGSDVAAAAKREVESVMCVTEGRCVGSNRRSTGPGYFGAAL